jgi:Holliday junction DNA helicase RuvA
MISHITGKLIHKDEKFLVLETGGLGYKVFATNELIQKSHLETSLSLWTHTTIRDDAHDLYGFEDKEEMDFFELLIGISGIGPKSALNILSLASLSSLKKAVSSGESAHLVKIAGIGKKNAEKIVMELKGKFEETTPNTKEENDALEGLKSLGYSYKEAHEALKKVAESGDTPRTSDKIKEALKILGK